MSADEGRAGNGPSRPDADDRAAGGLAEVPLGRILAHPHRAGENVKGALTGAAWTWLLPDPFPTRVAVVGPMDATAIRALRSSGTEVLAVAQDGSGGVTTLGPDPVDVLWLGADVAAAERATLDDRAIASRAALLVIEHPAGRSGATGPVTPPVGGGPGRSVRFRVRPGLADLRSAVPEADPGAETMLAERGLLADGARAQRRRSRAGRSGGGQPWRTVEIRDPAALPGRAGLGPGVEPPPTWLRRIAAEGGVAVEGWRFAFAAPGVYNTQKLLAFLAPPGSEDATIVVKATRDETAGRRLANEGDGLRRLADLGSLTLGRTPRLRFDGAIAGRVVVGEEVMPGRTLRAIGVRAADHPLVDDALGFLADLAVASAVARPTGDLTGGLAELVDRWAELTTPEPAVRHRVDADVDRLVGAAATIPTIFQHGDPGIWNLVARPGGPVAFLDWENFEPAGLPGWDVAYLLRSAVAGSPGRWQRARDRLVGGRARAVAGRFDRAARPGGPIAVALGRYASRVGIEPPVVAALVRLGWVYQALKEATRLPLGAGSRAAHQAMLRTAGWEPDVRRGGKR